MENEVTKNLDRFLKSMSNQGVGLALLAMIVFPLFENILVGGYTAAMIDGWVFGAFISILVLVHIIVAWLVLSSEAKTSQPSLLVSALNAEEDASKLQSELRRREQSYELIRQAFEQLTVETCAIEYREEREEFEPW